MTDTTKPNTQQKILDAAEQEFLEKGYFGATTAAIAKRAGITHAMLHYYFQSKDNLFNMVINKKIELMQPDISSIINDSSQPFLSKIQLLINMHFDMLTSNPDLPIFFVRDILPNAEIQTILSTSNQNNPLFHQFNTELTEAQQRGEIAPVTLMDLIIDILSLDIFPFLMLPAMRQSGSSDAQIALFLESRRQENIRLITDRLTPDTK